MQTCIRGSRSFPTHAFADLVKGDFELERVGEYPVRGFNAPVELFAYQG
jgi:adenylate cyclase